MKVESQTVESLLDRLSRLQVDWQDKTSTAAIQQLSAFPVEETYTTQHIVDLLKADFKTGSLILRLFLGMSKDTYEATLVEHMGKGNGGVTFFKKNPETYAKTLFDLGLGNAMFEETHRTMNWSDVLVERLRSGRGSAISGQKRGRLLEDHVETTIKRVFGDQYVERCTFTGQRNQSAKCDFAIPNLATPYIVIEAKGYDATGSKMSDVVGDVQAIIAAKRSDTAFLLFTDGLSWLQRQSDFRKLVELQNQGDITRIYTKQMSDQFEEDLRTLAKEYGL